MTANNIQFTNNLLYNVRAYGQSAYDMNVMGLSWPGGKGQLETGIGLLTNAAGIDGTYEMSDGTIVDMSKEIFIMVIM